MPRPDGMTAYAGTILVQGCLKTDLILIGLLGALRLKPSSHGSIASSGLRPLTKILNCCHIMCLGRVSAPAVQIILSDLLGVIGLVGRYPTNNLVPTQLIPLRECLLQATPFRYQAFTRRLRLVREADHRVIPTSYATG